MSEKIPAGPETDRTRTRFEKSPPKQPDNRTISRLGRLAVKGSTKKK